MTTRTTSNSDRGAVLVHVAMAIVALTAFSSFVVDYGVLWASRRQAQNVADSAALAGAISLMLDAEDYSSSSMAIQTAQALVNAGEVWGEAPVADITIGSAGCPSDVIYDKDCIRVDVFRTQARGNPLPVFFGGLIGLTSQNVRATATARPAPGNASNCMKPWAVADRWTENNPIIGAPWSPTSTFDPTGPNPDVYEPQNGVNLPGSGFNVAREIGVRMTLKPGAPAGTITPGWFQTVSLDGAPASYSNFRAIISDCIDLPSPLKVGDVIAKENSGISSADGVNDLIARDPNAVWDPLANAGRGAVTGSCASTASCTGTGGESYRVSPRIVAVPVFDLVHYLDTGGAGVGQVRIVNILGFFVERMIGNDIEGVLTFKPDLLMKGSPTIAGEAGFIRNIMLIR